MATFGEDSVKMVGNMFLFQVGRFFASHLSDDAITELGRLAGAQWRSASRVDQFEGAVAVACLELKVKRLVKL